MAGDETLLTVMPLPARAAGALAVESQLAAPARLKVVASTALVPFLLSSPLTANSSAAFNVMEKNVALLALTLLDVRVLVLPDWPVSVSLLGLIVSPVVMLA